MYILWCTYTDLIQNKEYDISTNKENKEHKPLPIVKALNEELMQVTYVAMKPGVDLHFHSVDLEEIRLAKESFNKSLMRANLFHMTMTDSFSIIESYLAPTDMILNKQLVTKGEWLVTLQVHEGHEDVWNMIKDDSITGVSIGAMGILEDVEED